MTFRQKVCQFVILRIPLLIFSSCTSGATVYMVVSVAFMKFMSTTWYSVRAPLGYVGWSQDTWKMEVETARALIVSTGPGTAVEWVGDCMLHKRTSACGKQWGR